MSIEELAAAADSSTSSAELKRLVERRRRRDWRNIKLFGLVLGLVFAGLGYVAFTTPAPVDDSPAVVAP